MFARGFTTRRFIADKADTLFLGSPYQFFNVSCMWRVVDAPLGIKGELLTKIRMGRVRQMQGKMPKTRIQALQHGLGQYP